MPRLLILCTAIGSSAACQPLPNPYQMREFCEADARTASVPGESSAACQPQAKESK
jgi:hypothetical protein